MTCLILTRNRRHWLPYAMQCAKYQTYPNKELLIVSSGEDVREVVSKNSFGLRHGDVRHVHLDGCPTIGAMRNVGCERACGEIIATFDDDDWSHPDRLTDQVTRLGSGQVTGYSSMRFHDGRKWWRYVGVSNYALGTSLVYRRAWWQAHRFQEIQVGEDNSFVHQAARVLTTADAGKLMWASVHLGNTSPRNMSTKQWQAMAL